MARVLIACEFSGIVRDAFLAQGHDAVSCDLLESEKPGPHIQGDVLEHLSDGWDLMVAFPPCTYLARSGARWYSCTREQDLALRFVRALMYADIPRIAIENPVGVISVDIRPPDQVIHPWMFGHGEKKSTCLWLDNLPRLISTDIVDGRVPRVHMNTRDWRSRSRTYPGIADAMANQWGRVLGGPST